MSLDWNTSKIADLVADGNRLVAALEAADLVAEAVGNDAAFAECARLRADLASATTALLSAIAA